LSESPSTTPKVKDFAAELGLNYPALIGGYGAIELSKSLGNRVGALPYTLFVDRDGRISRAHLGPLKPAELRRIIANCCDNSLNAAILIATAAPARPWAATPLRPPRARPRPGRATTWLPDRARIPWNPAGWARRRAVAESNIASIFRHRWTI
jgi:hypothetical protein